MSLDAAEVLPGLRDAGVAALKIEGRQRGRAYIESVVRSFREQLAALDAGETPPASGLANMTRGKAPPSVPTARHGANENWARVSGSRKLL